MKVEKTCWANLVPLSLGDRKWAELVATAKRRGIVISLREWRFGGTFPTWLTIRTFEPNKPRHYRRLSGQGGGVRVTQVLASPPCLGEFR